MQRVLWAALFLFAAAVDLNARDPWVTLEGGHYLRKRPNDGDSFHVSIKGKEYIFRLYFVDAPESTPEFVQRVEEQAKKFGITPKQTIQLGMLAKNYTREKLSGPFLIQTCWEDAKGRSRLQRFYAIVRTDSGDLGDQLVGNGLALVRGAQASPEGDTAARREWQKLDQLQRKAKREKVGGWGGAKHLNARANRATEAAIERIPESKLDVNSASATELENIPNIGPIIAKRIIEARPFHSADELQKITGIGRGKRYQEIRSYFQ